MPNSPAVRMMIRADSAPARWPSIRGKWRCLDHRPLPSMMIATCRGSEVLASALRWAAAELIFCLNKDRSLSPGSNRCNRQLRAGQLSNGLQIRPGLRGKVFPFTRLMRRFAPTREFRIHRFATSQQFDVVRHIIIALAAYAIGDADLDRFYGVQTIDIRHGQLIDPIHHAGMAGSHRIKPTAAPGTPSRCSKLPAHRMQHVRDL